MVQRVQPIRDRLQRGRAFPVRSEISRVLSKSSSAADLARRNHSLEEQFAGLRREHDDLRRTLFEAAQVQRRLCGPRQLRREPFEIATEIFPVRDLCGDFVSVLDLGAELLFAIGDIAGKGLSAAMWFTHLVGMIRLQGWAQESPAATLEAINRDLCGAQPGPPLTTLLLARLDWQTGEITYSNAGHPPALLSRRDGRVEWLREGGPLLGAVAGASFVNGKSALQPGDTLLGYSDGILECRNAAGVEFGVDRLQLALRPALASSASAALFSVLGAAEDFAGNQPREDDMALLVVRRNETSGR